MLGELNCAKSSAEHPSMVTEITDMRPQYQPDVRENPRSAHLAVRERILPTPCACTYPTLSIEKRLASTAIFIQQLFRARFPGTATDVTGTSVMALTQSQTNLTGREI